MVTKQVSAVNPSHFPSRGNNKVIQLYDHTEGKLRESDGQNNFVISGGADKTVRVWGHNAVSGKYAPATTLKTHKGEITGINLHPSSKYLTVASADNTWSLQNLETLQTPYHSPATPESFTSLALHPDGCLLGLGTLNSTVQIYNIRVQAFVASLAPENPPADPFVINTLSFSENRYHLAAPDSTSSVTIWDLRKQKAATSIALNADGGAYKINRIKYNPSALWFSVAGSHGVRLISHKT
ncbi:hypothetical protein FRB99_003694 [Tulasnella sp. 403]|nr:hypothetical protein FRB99_003694 [Tulasnella sp. 403]